MMQKKTEATIEGLRFPNITSTMLGSPIIRDYSIFRSILGSPYFGKLPNLAPTFVPYTPELTLVLGPSMIQDFLHQ